MASQAMVLIPPLPIQM